MGWERVGLWARAMAVAVDNLDNEEKTQIDRLVTAYRQFWGNAAALAGQISRDLPSLTLHDERHFLALWQRADQIAGSEYQLSPLEAFVFGGAILLHDAANCVAAFPGRMDEIRATDIWKDVAAEWMERKGISTGECLPAEAEQEVLFETLRSLHAERARTLADLEFGSGHERLRLLQDDQLRIHCGEVIGLIAASHHWDIGELSKQLQTDLGVPAGMPGKWKLRPIVLAGLLRCADAVQIDQSRVPDFLRGLLGLHGVSAEHWTAQNRLATPFIDQKDPRALCFTSTREFTEEDADAWWVVRDALEMADRELNTTDSLLRDLQQMPFAIDRIRDAASPERLAKLVRATGWRPVKAEVRISDVERVVDMFGGKQLYGDHPIVPLRELIQNGVDALQQRRALEQHFEGRLTIRLEGLADRPGFYGLSVEDDGIGMSEAVLTGPLIDFGSEYMASGLMKREYPGLRAKRVKRVGRYGVGFFSVFMIADEVLVTSRRHDAGIDAFRTLKFRKGLRLRPLLTQSTGDRPGSQVSTRVSLIISAATKSRLLSVKNDTGVDVPLTLAQVVGALCPMVDADIHVVEGPEVDIAHHRKWMNIDRLKWFEQIFPCEWMIGPRRHIFDSNNRKEIFSKISQHLTLVDVNDPSAGLACLLGFEGLGVHTIGGLRHDWLSGFMTEWSGAIDHNPRGPVRLPGSPRVPHSLAAWATRQACSASDAIPPSARLAAVAEAVVKYGGDAGPAICACLNGEWVSVDRMAEFFSSGEEAYCPLSTLDRSENIKYISYVEFSPNGYQSYRTRELERLVNIIEGGLDRENLIFRIDGKGNGILDKLRRKCSDLSYILRIEVFAEVEFAKYMGTPNERDGLVRGFVAKGGALKLWAEPIKPDSPGSVASEPSA